MRFFAHHGVSEQEATVGNDFLVSVRFSGNFTKACESDNVEDTVSYAEVCDLVRTEMARPSKLIEHVAYRILRTLKDCFPQIEGIEVQVAKVHPPVSGQMDYAAVTVTE